MNQGAATATPTISASAPPTMTATRSRRSMTSTVSVRESDDGHARQALGEDRAAQAHTRQQRPREHAPRTNRSRRPPEREQRPVGERDEREVVHRHLHEADRQRQRRVEDPCQPTATPAQDRARQQPGGDRAEQAEQQPRHTCRRFREPERPQRSGKRPEEQHRLVRERLAEKTRRDIVAAFHHRLRNRRVKALVGIDQRMMQDERKQVQRQAEEDEGGKEAAVCHACWRPCGDPRVPDARRQVGSIADQCIGAPIEQPPHVALLVDRPHLHGQARAVRGADEAP